MGFYFLFWLAEEARGRSSGAWVSVDLEAAGDMPPL
jgi:hypothetical protein